MKGKPNIITCRFNNALIKNVQSKINIVTPNCKRNFIWQVARIYNRNKLKKAPTYTHPCYLLGGWECRTNIKISIVHSYPNQTAQTVITVHDAWDVCNWQVFSLTLTVYMGRCVLEHTGLYTIIHMYTHHWNVGMWLSKCVCTTHKHPRVHARSLWAKGDETSPVKCLASLTILKIIMGASAIWSLQASAFGVGDKRGWISNFSS